MEALYMESSGRYKRLQEENSEDEKTSKSSAVMHSTDHPASQIYAKLIKGSFDEVKSKKLPFNFKNFSSHIFKIYNNNIFTVENTQDKNIAPIGKVFISNFDQSSVRTIKAHKGQINHFDIKDNTLVTASDKTIKIWDAETQKLKHTFAHKKHAVSCVHIHDSENVFVGYVNGDIHHFSGDTHRKKIKAKKLAQPVVFMHTMSNEGAIRLFSQTENMLIRHCTLPEYKSQYSTSENAPEFTHTIAVDDIIFRAYNDGTVKMMGGAKKLDLEILSLKKGKKVESLQFVDGRLYVKISNNTLKIFDFNKQKKSFTSLITNKKHTKEQKLAPVSDFIDVLFNNTSKSRKQVKLDEQYDAFKKILV